jgi:cytochrome c oxidase cbb3-type subunit II
LSGRDIYVREGCYNCHSQMIRPFRAETERYGHYSVAGEFVYDRPFQWGSKRTGPDLARVGGRYSDEWHRVHLINPRDVVPESNMPAYPWLSASVIDGERGPRMRAAALARRSVHRRADREPAPPKAVKGKTEMDALIAYLQGLGTAMQQPALSVREPMDINTGRGLITLVLLIVFIGIVLWAYSKGARRISTRRRGCRWKTTSLRATKSGR